MVLIFYFSANFAPLNSGYLFLDINSLVPATRGSNQWCSFFIPGAVFSIEFRTFAPDINGLAPAMQGSNKRHKFFIPSAICSFGFRLASDVNSLVTVAQGLNKYLSFFLEVCAPLFLFHDFSLIQFY